MKKIFLKIIIWILNKIFNSSMRNDLEPCIKNLYKKIAEKKLPLRNEMLRVKKGKKKYDLLFLKL